MAAFDAYPAEAFIETTTSPLLPTEISHLPEELIALILRHVENTESSSQFWTCLMTCRQWHRIGLGLRPLDLSMRATVESKVRRQELEYEAPDMKINIATDLYLNCFSKLFLSELRSLTLHVVHARIAAPFRAIQGADWPRSLTDTFNTMRKLSTFSLKFADDGWDFPDLNVPAVAQSTLASLVAALPETVISLEIDTMGTDLPPSDGILDDDPSKHLCYQIQKIFGRLHHLRLRVGHVCEALIPLTSTHRRDSFIETSQSYIARPRSTSTLSPFQNLQTLTIYLPWHFICRNSPFLLAIRSLVSLLPPPISPNSVTVIHQLDRHIPHRTTIANPPTTPYHFFIQTAHLTFNFQPQHLNQPEPHQGCFPAVVGDIETDNHFAPGFPSADGTPFPPPDPTTMTRYFYPGLQDPRTTFPHIASWTLESSSRWAQDHHRGPRYPHVLGATPSSPFWKPSHRCGAAVAEGGGDDGEGEHEDESRFRFFACLFPGCAKRCQSLAHLRGHLCYAHRERPHSGMWFGEMGGGRRDTRERMARRKGLLRQMKCQGR
jgi:hypothetical protein